MSSINKYPRHIMKRFHESEEKFYKIIDSLEGYYIDRGEEFPAILLDHFSPYLSWCNGFTSSEEVLKTVEKAGDLRKVAETKVTKKLKKFLEAEMTRGVRFPQAENKIRTAIEKLEKQVLDPYNSYLVLSKRYIEKIMEEEKNQVKVIYGSRVDKKEGIVWEAMTLNQSIKYIKHAILPFCERMYIMEDYLVTFESEWGTEWFLAPESYVKVFEKVFGITTGISIGKDKKEFYSKIGEAIEESRV